MMFRNGPFQLSAECIYDEYGFGRPGFNPLDITWVKSIYYRDVSSGQQGVPCTGIGYYVNLGYADGPWNTTLNYGDFYPLYTGTAPDQRVQHRGLAKVAYQLAQAAPGLLGPDRGKRRLHCPRERAPHTVRRAGRIPPFQYSF